MFHFTLALLCAFVLMSHLSFGQDNQAERQPAEDPLAEFSRIDENEDRDPPLPTPGGFQQPSNVQEGLAYEAMQLETEMTLEDMQREVERQTREAAYEAAVNSLMPMRPSEIREMLEYFKRSREAGEQRIGGIPEPVIKVETISLDPGARPPVVLMSPGHVTSLNILDITGQPWPVQNVSWGGNFEIISPDPGGHIIKMSPMKAHEIGNMSVQLLGLKTPVTFMLQTQLETVQYRFDAMIPEYGPYADMPLIDPGITTVAGDTSLTTVLQGVVPSGAKRMRVKGVDGRTSVFRFQNQSYVRTPLTLLSPGWSQSAKSADGTTVYVIDNTPVLLLSERGNMVRATIEDDEE
jgi:intracellular multiplication protein IcmK